MIGEDARVEIKQSHAFESRWLPAIGDDIRLPKPDPTFNGGSCNSDYPHAIRGFQGGQAMIYTASFCT